MSKREEHSNDLSAYLDGELSPSRAKHIEGALQYDKDLAGELARLKATRDLLRQMPVSEAPKDFVRHVVARSERHRLLERSARRNYSSFRWISIAAAAVVLMAVGLSALLMIQIEKDPGPAGATDAGRIALAPEGDADAPKAHDRERENGVATPPPGGPEPRVADEELARGLRERVAGKGGPRHEDRDAAEAPGTGAEKITYGKSGERAHSETGSEASGAAPARLKRPAPEPTAPDLRAKPDFSEPELADKKAGYKRDAPKAEPVAGKLSAPVVAKPGAPKDVPGEAITHRRAGDGWDGRKTRPILKAKEAPKAELAAKKGVPPPAVGLSTLVIHTDSISFTQRDVEKAFARNGVRPVAPARKVAQQPSKGLAAYNYYQTNVATVQQVQYEAFVTDEQLAKIRGELSVVRAQQRVSQMPVTAKAAPATQAAAAVVTSRAKQARASASQRFEQAPEMPSNEKAGAGQTVAQPRPATTAPAVQTVAADDNVQKQIDSAAKLQAEELNPLADAAGGKQVADLDRQRAGGMNRLLVTLNFRTPAGVASFEAAQAAADQTKAFLDQQPKATSPGIEAQQKK